MYRQSEYPDPEERDGNFYFSQSWDSWLALKRLEKATWPWPMNEESTKEIKSADR